MEDCKESSAISVIAAGARKLLTKTRGVFAALVASAMDAIISMDEEYCIILFNAAAEKIFGCSAAEAVGEPVERFIPERFRSAHVGHVRRFAETGATGRLPNNLGELWCTKS